MGSSLNSGPFRVLFIRVPYSIGDPKKYPHLENYPIRNSNAELDNTNLGHGDGY